MTNEEITLIIKNNDNILQKYYLHHPEGRSMDHGFDNFEKVKHFAISKNQKQKNLSVDSKSTLNYSNIFNNKFLN